MRIRELLKEKQIIEAMIEKTVHGSIEIREGNDNKYIYLHFRDEGKLVTRYAGEYSNELYNVILENNIKARQYKKHLRDIKKELASLNYVESKLDPIVALNIDFARKNLVDSIYKQSVLEGVVTTYSDTETLVEGGKIMNMTATDAQKVINLKQAWEFILTDGVVDIPSNFIILSQINAIVEEGLSYSAGKVRSIPVKIGGSSYIPPIPFEAQIKEDIETIVNSNDDVVEKAISALLYIKRKQIFLDGNKRTAVIFANHILIKSGSGLLVVPNEKVSEYKKLLIEYYETNDSSNIRIFLRNECYRPLK
jgi:Fic family protein